MKRISYLEIKKLENLATSLTNIEPIEDREYIKLGYEKKTTKHNKNTKITIIQGRFKSKRRKL